MVTITEKKQMTACNFLVSIKLKNEDNIAVILRPLYESQWCQMSQQYQNRYND